MSNVFISNPVELISTLGFTWSFLMTLFMLWYMVPLIEKWSWKGLLQDVAVVIFVGVFSFFLGAVSFRRWFELPPYVTAIAVTVMAIALTPIAWRIRQKAKGII